MRLRTPYEQVTKNKNTSPTTKRRDQPHYQQVTTRLQGTDKTVWQRQTRNTNYKENPQKKCRLGKVSKKITGRLKHI